MLSREVAGKVTAPKPFMGDPAPGQNIAITELKG
jgi:hypothetical protein